MRQQISKLTNQMDMMARKKDEMDHSARILLKSIKQNEMAVEKLKYGVHFSSNVAVKAIAAYTILFSMIGKS